jgi:hypothetical protein
MQFCARTPGANTDTSARTLQPALFFASTFKTFDTFATVTMETATMTVQLFTSVAGRGSKLMVDHTRAAKAQRF